MRGRWHWAIPAGVTACFLAPILLTDRTFATDWGNHYWLIYMQGQNIGALGEPSLYLQSTLGAFYPYYAFYGGTFYAVAGFLAHFLGTEPAVLLATGGATAANYLGWTWIARQAGVKGWRQQLPGLIAVTAPLAVSNTYGRGGIPELVATSMLPLVAAAGISLVREPRVRLRDMVAFVVGLVFLTGTHALTMVWGLSLLLVLSALAIACYWPFVKQRAMRLVGIAWLAVLGGAINAWIIWPTLVFRDKTLENSPDPITQTAYTDPENLFRVLRNIPNLYPQNYADVEPALPVLAVVWALVCGALFWRLGEPRLRALGIGLATVFAALVALILHPPLIDDLPEVLRYLQFPYRIVTFADFCVVGMVVVVLAAIERAERPPRWAVPAVGVLTAIAAFSFAISVKQMIDTRSFLPSRDKAVASSVKPPRSWYAIIQFGDGEGPVLQPTLPRPLLVPVEEGIRDTYTVRYPPGPAGTAQTNINTGDYLVDVEGARPVGRSEAGQMIVRLPASPRRPRTVVVSGEDSATVVISRWISVISLLAALVALASFPVIRRRRRA